MTDFDRLSQEEKEVFWQNAQDMFYRYNAGLSIPAEYHSVCADIKKYVTIIMENINEPTT